MLCRAVPWSKGMTTSTWAKELDNMDDLTSLQWLVRPLPCDVSISGANGRGSQTDMQASGKSNIAVSSIYQWFSYFRHHDKPDSWKSSIRHPDRAQSPPLHIPPLHIPLLQLQSAPLQSPPLQLPPLQLPLLQSPPLQSPPLQLPLLQLPLLQLPHLQIPPLQIPLLQIPHLQIPPLQIPLLQSPPLQIPLLQIPPLQRVLPASSLQTAQHPCNPTGGLSVSQQLIRGFDDFLLTALLALILVYSILVWSPSFGQVITTN